MTKRILIVDDEEPVRKALRRTLACDEYEIIEACGAREGLTCLQERPIDLVISDYLMPDMNGLQFLKHARALRPDALRVMLTGHADLDIAVDAINEGAVYRFLLKPWDSFDLRVMVKLALRHLDALRETDGQADRSQSGHGTGERERPATGALAFARSG